MFEERLGRDFKPVLYSYEHGDESLPCLRDLVSDKPDPMKGKILAYLRTHMIYVCPGSIKDEIDPEKSIGCGDTYTDDIYYWNDVFLNYVARYNIPVPEDFRNHILENFNPRMKRHALLKLVDSVKIHNNPYVGMMYDVYINKTGKIIYKSTFDYGIEEVFSIRREEAEFIIVPGMEDLFCYDMDGHGFPMIDSYNWALSFYRKGELVDKIEGWPDEDMWRYKCFKGVVKFIERRIGRSLGSGLMKFDEDQNEA